MRALVDVHDIAAAMPRVTVEWGSRGNAVYQMGGKSFVFFRNTRPDAVGPTRRLSPDVSHIET